jgi:hypothetical protein
VAGPVAHSVDEHSAAGNTVAPDAVAGIAGAVLAQVAQVANIAGEEPGIVAVALSIVAVAEPSIEAVVEAGQEAAAPAPKFVAPQSAARRVVRSVRRNTDIPSWKAERRVHSGGRPS